MPATAAKVPICLPPCLPAPLPLCPSARLQVSSVKKGVRYYPPAVKAGLQRLELAREHLKVGGLACLPPACVLQGFGQPQRQPCCHAHTVHELRLRCLRCLLCLLSPAGCVRCRLAAVPGELCRALPALPRRGASPGGARLPLRPGHPRLQPRVSSTSFLSSHCRLQASIDPRCWH